MIVQKFGGTSLGSAQRIQSVAHLVLSQDAPSFIVLSAMSGTTNILEKTATHISNGHTDAALSLIDELEQKYHATSKELYSTETCLSKATSHIERVFHTLRTIADDPQGGFEKIILAQGEILSTHLFTYYIEEYNQSKKVALLDAFDFMKIDKNEEPDAEHIRSRLNYVMARDANASFYVTQGYICLNDNSDIDNLKRGGSDYTASLIGAALSVEEIQIWTDIDGLHNGDPRYVDDTIPVRHLSFNEAAELAYFGAKVLHPSTILPAQKEGIPIRIKNTMKPEADGSLISMDESKEGVKSVAAKDGITIIKIKSSRMLMAHGFLSKIFQIFSFYKISIDVITTSEIAVSLSIDDCTHLDAVVSELQKLGHVEVDHNMTIIAVVGNNIIASVDRGKIFDIMDDTLVRMISYGGSRYNITIIVQNTDKKKVLECLHHSLFLSE